MATPAHHSLHSTVDLDRNSDEAAALLENRPVRIATTAITILCLAGCDMDRQAPVDPPAQHADKHTYAATVAAPAEPTVPGIVSVTSPGATAEDVVSTKAVRAGPASKLGLLTSGDGRTKQGSFLVTYATTLSPAEALVCPIVVTNTSSRAFPLGGIVVRAAPSRPEITATVQPSVPKGQPLAPGESVTIPVTVQVTAFATGDAVTVKLYEVPKSIADDGMISARGEASVTLSLTATVSPVELPTTTRKVDRSWPASRDVPQDLALIYKD